MPKDPIDIICAEFMRSATDKENEFWKTDILYSVVGIIYYRFEQLFDCYPDNPKLIIALLSHIRAIAEKYSDMKSSRQARSTLWERMTQANISCVAVNRVDWIAKGAVGDHFTIERALNLSFLDLKAHSDAIKRLSCICLSHFEERVAEQLAEKQAAEAEPAYFSPQNPGA